MISQDKYIENLLIVQNEYDLNDNITDYTNSFSREYYEHQTEPMEIVDYDHVITNETNYINYDSSSSDDTIIYNENILEKYIEENKRQNTTDINNSENDSNEEKYNDTIVEPGNNIPILNASLQSDIIEHLPVITVLSLCYFMIWLMLITIIKSEQFIHFIEIFISISIPIFAIVHIIIRCVDGDIYTHNISENQKEKIE